MASHPRLMPTDPRMFTAKTVGSYRVSPTFQRVTIASDDLAGFDWRGLDHWFRLFFPLPGAGDLKLPTVVGGQWWKSYLEIPEHDRPHYSNYTVSAYRRTGGTAELDIDVVLHWHQGALTGVAEWSVNAQPGSPVGLLDQGVLFDPPSDTEQFVLVADESGLPALRGILRDLPADAVGTAIIEVPAQGDVHPIQAPRGVDVQWVPRDVTGDRIGHRALQALQDCPVDPPKAYGFVVGESGLATQGRRTLHQAGLPKERITFSGFWRA